MRHLVIIILIISYFSISSCVYDCINKHEGFVLDNNNKPIEGVNIQVLMNDTFYNGYRFVYDTIPIKPRELLITQNGNMEHWYNLQEHNGYLYKNAALLKDSTGFYNISFIKDKCPKVRLIFLKSGYIPKTTNELAVFDLLTIKFEKIKYYEKYFNHS